MALSEEKRCGFSMQFTHLYVFAHRMTLFLANGKGRKLWPFAFVSRPFLCRVFDAQHFGNLGDNSINQYVIEVRNKFARPLHSPHTPKRWMLV